MDTTDITKLPDEYQAIADRWPSGIVARAEIATMTGGLIGAKTMANLDSRGMGPEKRIVANRRVAYPVIEFLKWLSKRGEIITTKKTKDSRREI